MLSFCYKFEIINVSITNKHCHLPSFTFIKRKLIKENSCLRIRAMFCAYPCDVNSLLPFLCSMCLFMKNDYLTITEVFNFAFNSPR